MSAESWSAGGHWISTSADSQQRFQAAFADLKIAHSKDDWDCSRLPPWPQRAFASRAR